MSTDPVDSFSREHLPLSAGEHLPDGFDLFGDVICGRHGARPCADTV
jgi:hypothetical protein